MRLIASSILVKCPQQTQLFLSEAYHLSEDHFCSRYIACQTAICLHQNSLSLSTIAELLHSNYKTLLRHYKLSFPLTKSIIIINGSNYIFQRLKILESKPWSLLIHSSIYPSSVVEPEHTSGQNRWVLRSIKFNT